MGRGATAAALAWRAFLRETFLPGYIWSNLSDRVQSFSQHDKMLRLVVGVRHLVHRWKSGLLQGNRTWSKWVRTRRCQSLRKSGRKLSASITPSIHCLDCVCNRSTIERTEDKMGAGKN